MNITHLRYFIEIYETQSISIASQNLYVTQPAISLSLKKIEDYVGCALFSRVNNEYVLTEVGEIVYKSGVEIIKQINSLTQKIEDYQNFSKTETIRVGMNSLFSVKFMKQISLFMAKNNQVKVSLVQEGSFKLQQKILDNLIDVAIITLPNSHPEKINVELLSNASFNHYEAKVVIPHSNPLSQNDSLTFEDLSEQNFSALSDNFTLGRAFAKGAKDYGLQDNFISYHNDIQILLHSLESTNSITLLPIEYSEIFDFKNLAWLPFEDKNNYFNIGIATSKERSLSDNTIAFIDTLKTN